MMLRAPRLPAEPLVKLLVKLLASPRGDCGSGARMAGIACCLPSDALTAAMTALRMPASLPRAELRGCCCSSSAFCSATLPASARLWSPYACMSHPSAAVLRRDYEQPAMLGIKSRVCNFWQVSHCGVDVIGCSASSRDFAVQQSSSCSEASTGVLPPAMLWLLAPLRDEVATLAGV